jgi:hypothetical protein
MRCLKTAAACGGLSLITMIAATTSGVAQDTMSSSTAVGTVALIEGHAYAQKGDILYTRPNVGSKIRQRDSDEDGEAAFAKWEQSTRRHLKPNDTVYAGEILQTTGDGWLKILFKDDSVMDVGPAGLIKVESLSGSGPTRQVVFKLLYGKIRTLVAQPLKSPDLYKIYTPSLVLGVRGTEFLVNSFPGKNGKTESEVLCLHGQVSVDVTKNNETGLVYNQPVVVNPGAYFSTQAEFGVQKKMLVRKLQLDELRQAVARLSPQVDAFGSLVGSSPPPARLAGTGLELQNTPVRTKPQIAARNIVSTFDLDHPPLDRKLASPSGNFEVPHDYQMDPAAFGQLPDMKKATGAPPISQLPLSTSHVKVNLNGI